METTEMGRTLARMKQSINIQGVREINVILLTVVGDG